MTSLMSYKVRVEKVQRRVIRAVTVAKHFGLLAVKARDITREITENFKVVTKRGAENGNQCEEEIKWFAISAAWYAKNAERDAEKAEWNAKAADWSFREASGHISAVWHDADGVKRHTEEAEEEANKCEQLAKNAEKFAKNAKRSAGEVERLFKEARLIAEGDKLDSKDAEPIT